MTYMKILAGIALLGSIGWVIAQPGFESGLAVVGSLSTFVSAIVIEKRHAVSVRQKQSISKSSIGVQAGGDVNIGGDNHA